MKDIFKKDIDRSINGVIKVGQLGEADITQELEEYVITRELSGYFDQFYRRYVDALGNPTDRIGVWISGFFGSGKSHFLKILSYLLDNKEVGGKTALAYFQPKVDDSMLYASMQRAGEVSKDVILFNIDSKADSSSKADKEAIVAVFLKVFNEHLGYFGVTPGIAELERRLEAEGKYEAFQSAYEDEVGRPWVETREKWDFYEDEVIRALQAAMGISESAARTVFERADENYPRSPEQFAKTIRTYLQNKPRGHQVLFLVDEVGQYIGDNSNLMLNLQTVAEDLGTQCEGRAWVMVTSQEDIDSITQNRVKGNDFSKIQGRFQTRLSLSSANTDEVIRLRLLEKTPDAEAALKALYATKEQVLKNQIRFSEGTADMPGYGGAEDFVKSYPFVPYQFKLLQQVFTQIRLHGASGKHLSQGERSMLNAFQGAAQRIEGEAIGALAPFHTFYGAVEGFLDASVKLVITQASENSRLHKPFDAQLLAVLFMIKYVKEIKGTVENLTTLSLSHIDQDRLALRSEVERSLNRLERETLIQRSGEAYEFLTNEEQDIGREIKNFTVAPGQVQGELQKIIWDEIFTLKKYRFDARHDYGFNRKLDEQVYGSQTDDLTLHILTPEGDDYTAFMEDATALMRSGSGQAVIVRLPDDRTPFDELTQYVKTGEYAKQKRGAGLTPSLRTILETRADENRERRERVVAAVKRLIAGADLFVQGTKLPQNSLDAKDSLQAGLKHLVENTYTKLGYIESPFVTDDEIEAVFRNGGGSVQPDAEGNVANAPAHADLLGWLNDQQNRHQTVTLRALEDHFGSRPYGWARRDIQGVLAELLVQGKAELKQAQATVDLRDSGLVNKMGSRQGLDSYTVRVPRTVNPEALRIARELAQEYLGMAVAPSEPQALYERYRQALGTKLANVKEQLAMAKQGDYPFVGLLGSQQTLLKTLLDASGAAAFFETLREHEDAFEEMAVQGEAAEAFFRGQVDAFDKARTRLSALEPELPYLDDADTELRRKVGNAKRILALPDPTREIPQLASLLSPVEARVGELREAHKADALQAWGSAQRELTTLAETQGLPEAELAPLLGGLNNLQDEIASAPSIDAAVARKARIVAVASQVTERVVARINELARQRAQVSVPDGSAAAPARLVRQLKTFRPASVAPRGVLETPQDVERYLDDLKRALLTELETGHALRLE